MTGTAAWLALLLALGSGSLLAQQPAVLTGRVINGTTGEGIASAQVVVADERRTADNGGRFRTGPVQAGKHLLEVRAIGYSAYSRELIVLPGQSVSLTIELTPVVHQLESVSVVAGREPSIGGDELAARGGNLATALNGWQGIVISRTGYGNEAIAQIRGSGADEVLVLVDGFALNDPFTGRADLSRVAVQDIETVSLLRGAQTARAGARAMAGVIEIQTRQVHQPEFQVGIGSAKTRQARVAAGAGPGALVLNLETLPRDFTVDLPSGGEGRRSNAGGDIWTLNGRARLGVDWTLRGSLSDRGLPGTTVNPTRSARGRDWSVLVGARGGHRTWFSTSIQWLDTQAADRDPPPGFIEYDSHTWGWGSTVEVGLRRPIQLGGWVGEYSLGLEGRHDRFAGDAVREDANFTRGGTTLAGSMTRVGKWGSWTLTPAFRLDWFTGRSSPVASGRVDVEWTRGRTNLTGSLGNGVTVPALADLLFRDGVGIAINPDLRPERVTWEAEAGIGQSFSILGLPGSLRVGGFYGRIEDMILWTPNFRNIWSPGNFGVRRAGGETNLEIRAGRLEVSGAAVFSSVTYDIPGGSQVPYRPRFSSSIQSRWTTDRWRLSLGWNHLGTRFSRNRGMNPLSPFHLFHLAVERRLGRFSLEGEIRDLSDARPVYIAGFPTPGRTFHLSLTLELP